MSILRIALALIAALGVIAGAARGASPGAPALERISVQLNWKHQFQFAGFYAATEMGYYRDAGFEPNLIEAQEGRDPIDAVLAGSADYGVGASELALRRARGERVVALATILQHSPLVILAHKHTGDTVQSLIGRKLMIMPHETELYAYLEREGVPLDRIRTVPHSFDPQDLIKGRVDAISGYSTDEPYILRRAGLPFVALSPRSSGVDFYADTLFTTETVVKRDPARVKAFLAATLRGWQYAMDHPAETADIILERYSRRHSREHLLFEAAEMRRLMQPELIEIGHMNAGRWQHIADVYSELGMLPREYSLKGFLFDPNPHADLTWLLRGLIATALALLIAGIYAGHQYRVNRALQNEIAKRTGVESRLRETNQEMQHQLQEIRSLQTRLEDLAIRDGLTGLYNRRYLDDALERELARAQREGHAVSLVLIDLDNFKKLNDSYGHQAGDAVLKSLAQMLEEQVRSSDIACRWGGEEFVLVLPSMRLDAAAERADIWRARFADAGVRFGEFSLRTTLSVGVAAYPEQGTLPAQLLRAADEALYRAKSAGRNRVEKAPPGKNRDEGEDRQGVGMRDEGGG